MFGHPFSIFSFPQLPNNCIPPRIFCTGVIFAYNYDDQFAKLGTSDFDNAVDDRAKNHWSVYRGDLFQMWIASDANAWVYDSYKQSGDNPRSNYVLKKFMPDEDVPLSWQTIYTNPWIYFRLAEIYLNYAEAKFELGDEATCREYLKKVRARVGMPPIPDDVTGEKLRQRIYNERRVELAFEDHSFWDVRRWKIAMDVENRPIYGMDIIKDKVTGAYTYTPVQLSIRNFEEKMYLLPIATDEINKNKGSLTQTPGW